jgi:hypothetical protein
MYLLSRRAWTGKRALDTCFQIVGAQQDVLRNAQLLARGRNLRRIPSRRVTIHRRVRHNGGPLRSDRLPQKHSANATSAPVPL